LTAHAPNDKQTPSSRLAEPATELANKPCHLDCRESATGLTNKACHLDWRKPATAMEKSLSSSPTNHRHQDSSTTRSALRSERLTLLSSQLKGACDRTDK